MFWIAWIAAGAGLVITLLSAYVYKQRTDHPPPPSPEGDQTRAIAAGTVVLGLALFVGSLLFALMDLFNIPL